MTGPSRKGRGTLRRGSGPGRALLPDGKGFPEAIHSFENAVDHSIPELAGAWLNLAAVKGPQGRHEEALLAVEKALQIDPEDALTFNNKGGASSGLGGSEEALTCFEKATTPGPRVCPGLDEQGFRSREDFQEETGGKIGIQEGKGTQSRHG